MAFGDWVGEKSVPADYSRVLFQGGGIALGTMLEGFMVYLSHGSIASKLVGNELVVAGEHSWINPGSRIDVASQYYLMGLYVASILAIKSMPGYLLSGYAKPVLDDETASRTRRGVSPVIFSRVALLLVNLSLLGGFAWYAQNYSTLGFESLVVMGSFVFSLVFYGFGQYVTAGRKLSAADKSQVDYGFAMLGKVVWLYGLGVMAEHYLQNYVERGFHQSSVDSDVSFPKSAWRPFKLLDGLVPFRVSWNEGDQLRAAVCQIDTQSLGGSCKMEGENLRAGLPG